MIREQAGLYYLRNLLGRVLRAWAGVVVAAREMDARAAEHRCAVIVRRCFYALQRHQLLMLVRLLRPPTHLRFPACLPVSPVPLASHAPAAMCGAQEERRIENEKLMRVVFHRWAMRAETEVLQRQAVELSRLKAREKLLSRSFSVR